jgi:general secretion pathway protein A
MYEKFFGFRERPFDLTPNPRFLVLTDGHREALGNMEYAIASRKGITLLVGEAGCGKTTVIRTAIERQPARVRCVYIHNPALTRGEFVEMLATQFELTDHARRSKTALLVELEALLRKRREAQETTLLVVDEAQSLPHELLEEIRLLANIETSEEKLLSLVIAGQPEIAGRLNEPALRQLKQRIALRCELRALTLRETLAYIAGRIRAAGGVAAETFSREAVMLIHERSRGIPRSINVLADNALVAGFATGQRPVNSQTVTEVCRDFDAPGVGASVLVQGVANDIAGEEPVAGQADPEGPNGTPVLDTTARRAGPLDPPSVESSPTTTPAAADDTTETAEEPATSAFSRAQRLLFFQGARTK